MKNLAILLTASLIAAAAGYFVFVAGGEIDEMTLIVESGEATIDRNGDQISVEDSQALQEGDLIKTDGVAKLRLTGDRLAFMEGKTRVFVSNDRTLDAQGGSVRAQSSDDDAFKVTFGDVSAQATNSNFRVDQGVGSTRVGTYGGVVNLSTPGQPDVRVPQYFEAAVAVGDLPEEPRPYRFDTEDFWDLQFLDSVMALDDDLIQAGSALSGNLGGAKPPLGYFSGLAKSNVDFMRRYLKRPTEELLIGFTVAENAGEGSLKSAFTRSFKLRDDGGRWGIVASIVDAQRGPLVAQLRELVAGTGVAGGGDPGDETSGLTFAAGDGTGPAEGGDVPNPPGSNDPPPENPDPNPNPPKDPEPPGEDCQSGTECDLDETTDETQDEIDDILPGDEESPPPDEDQPPLTDGVLNGGDGLR